MGVKIENFLFAINAIAPLFLLVLLGRFFRVINIYDGQFIDGGYRFIFSILFPLSVFRGIYENDYYNIFNIELIWTVLIVLIVSAILSWLAVPLFEKDNNKKGVIIQSLFRNNCVLIGIPLGRNLFGEECVGIISMVLAFYIPVVNMLSVLTLSYYSKMQRKSIKALLFSIIKNPFIISALTAIVLSVMRIQIPYIIDRVLKDISAIATPLALIFLGGSIELGSAFKKYANYIVIINLVKLIILPAIILMVSLFYGMRDIELVIMLSIFGSSTGVASHSMAMQMGLDHELAGVIVASTIMFSSFTLFLFVWLLKFINAI